MDNRNLCGCPYHKSCHEVRQRGQIQFRKELANYNKLEDCDFYRLLKPMYEKKEGEENDY